MKKLITIILILALLLPAASLADESKEKYKASLGMTIETFINKYNAVAAPLGNSYMMLDKPISWTASDVYNFAWFVPAKDSSVVIGLGTKQKDATHVLTGGLDLVEILMQKDTDFLDLISVTARCTDIFSVNYFNMSMGENSITRLMRFFYESGYKGSQGSAYLAINEDYSISLEFCYSENKYYFLIIPTEDLT